MLEVGSQSLKEKCGKEGSYLTCFTCKLYNLQYLLIGSPNDCNLQIIWEAHSQNQESSDMARKQKSWASSFFLSAFCLGITFTKQEVHFTFAELP